MMRIGSLFSGAGGLDMAVEQVFGATTAWHCEIDPAASKVLAHRYPGVPNHRDITTLRDVEPVDIIAGGWPCQPWSLAGKRKGKDDERALWPYVAGAIRMVRPKYVVLENVSAVIVLGELARAVGDLHSAGYDAQWTCLRASDAGAAHSRERVFILATDTESASERARLRPGGLSLKHRRGHCHDAPRSSGARHSILDYGPFSDPIRHWESIFGRVAPPAAELNHSGRPLVSPAFGEWLMGWPAGWVTDVPGLTTDDQLRIVGNGVCPQQAVAALRWLLSVSEVAA